MKSKASLVTCAALVAFTLLLPSMCEAITIKAASGKITASGNSKNHILVKWSAVKGATKYGIIRSTSPKLNTSNLKKLKFFRTFGKSTRSYKDTTAKLGYKYYYWYGAIAGSTLYYCPVLATGKRKMVVDINIHKYSDGKNWLKLKVNGKAVTKAGVKYKVTVTGDWSFVKSAKSDGRVGYFNFKKKKGGSGKISIKVGSTSYATGTNSFSW